MLIAGRTVCYRVIGQGTFHCERCGGDRPYRHRSGRMWLHLLRMPVIPLAGTGEHLQCKVCRTCYRVELLAVPTMSQMHAALLTGTKAAAHAMLVAGDPASPAARRLAITLIQEAGSPDYDDARLATDLTHVVPAGPGSGTGPAGDVESVLGTLAVQLEVYAKEWFLAGVVRIGLADGALSGAERQAVRTIARYFGLTQAQAQDVIWLTEEAATAG